MHLTATVTQVIPLGRGVTVAADLSGFGGSPEAPPDSYDGTTAIWDLTAVTCAPANGAIEIIVTGANASNETSSDADTIFADNTPPTAVTDFDAVPGHERCELTWANGTDDNLLGVTVRRTGIPSEYPSYSTFITEWPVEEAETLYPAGPDSGHAVYDGTPIEALVDTVSPRGICFYQAFCYDEAMNVGPASTTARDAATDYWLGDVTDGGAPGMYDGYVGFEDLMIFAIHYGSTGPVGQGAECDFGPTVHPVRGGLGLPTPDGAVEFEDLMIFALNYGETSPIVRAVPLLPDAAAGGTPVLTLDRRGATDAGDVEIALRLEGNTGEVKGLSAVVAYDASELRLVAVRRSEEFASPSAEVFFWHEMTVGGVRVDAAVLGSGLAIGGSGDIAVMTFRPIADGFDVSFASGILRDAANVPIDAELGTYNGMSEPPLAFRLLQNVPNPFNPITTVGYHVPSTSAVKVEIYDVTGRLVRTLVDGEAVPGRHCAIWDGRSDTGSQVGSGIYFCRMEAEDFLDTRKMLLLK